MSQFLSFLTNLLNRNELQMSNARHDQVTLLDEFQMTYVEVELVSRVSLT